MNSTLPSIDENLSIEYSITPILGLGLYSALRYLIVPSVLEKFIGDRYTRQTNEHKEELVYQSSVALFGGIIALFVISFFIRFDLLSEYIRDPIHSYPSMLDILAPMALGYLIPRLVRVTYKQILLSNKLYNPQRNQDDELAQITPIAWIVLDVLVLVFSLCLRNFGILSYFLISTIVCDTFNAMYLFLKLVVTKAEMSSRYALLKKSLMAADCFIASFLRFFSGPLVLFLMWKHYTELRVLVSSDDIELAFCIVVLISAVSQSAFWLLRTVFCVFILFGMSLDHEESDKGS